MERAIYEQYAAILHEELLPAMGCTEPIAIAYAAAQARELLGVEPESVTVAVSGNIVKNVKSVVVPHTGGLRGIAAAACAGIVMGDASRRLEVISDADECQTLRLKEYLERTPVDVELAETGHIFDIGVTVRCGGHSAYVRITDHHTNTVIKEKDGVRLMTGDLHAPAEETLTDRSCLSIEGICEFADSVCPDDVRDVLERQIGFNMAIAEEGMRNSYGANIGKVLLDSSPDTVRVRARAYAAAGSDARMNGCELPVVIVSGSGNQGITASVPVVIYAREYGKSHEELLKALLVSDLVTIHLKTGIGRLSAYCGAVSAGVGAGAGITYLLGGGAVEISHTVVNAVAIVSGIICDGAKASCAAKIAQAVEAGILGYEMYCRGNEFYGGDGIVAKGVENTIRNVDRLAHDGMAQTDKEIISIMLGC